MTNLIGYKFARTTVRPQVWTQGGVYDKTAGKPFCTAEGCPQSCAHGGVQ